MQLSGLTTFLQRALLPLFFVVGVICAATTQDFGQTSVSSANQQMARWQKLTSSKGKFSVDLPMQPEAVVVPIETQNAALDLNSYVSKNTGSLFIASYIDYINIPKTKDSLEEAFDAARNQMLNSNESAFLTSEKSIDVQGYPGREILFQDGVASHTIKIILVKERGYFLQAVVPLMRNLPAGIAEVYQAESDKFFNSFKILDNKPQVVRLMKVKAK